MINLYTPVSHMEYVFWINIAMCYMTKNTAWHTTVVYFLVLNTSIICGIPVENKPISAQYLPNIWDLEAVSIRKSVLPGMAIPMLKIRRPNGRLIFNMEIAIRR